MTNLHRTLVLTAMLLSASPSAAQVRDSTTRPFLGSETVRLFEGSNELVRGVLLRRDSTSLVVVDRRTRDTVRIPLFQITRAEVQRGSHRRGGSAVGNGAAVGAVVGGIVLGLMLASPGDEDKAIGVAIGGVFAVVATGIGAAIGAVASFTPTETWVTFDPAAVPLQTSSAPAMTGCYAISTSTRLS